MYVNNGFAMVKGAKINKKPPFLRKTTVFNRKGGNNGITDTNTKTENI